MHKLNNNKALASFMFLVYLCYNMNTTLCLKTLFVISIRTAKPSVPFCLQISPPKKLADWAMSCEGQLLAPAECFGLWQWILSPFGLNMFYYALLQKSEIICKNPKNPFLNNTFFFLLTFSKTSY